VTTDLDTRTRTLAAVPLFAGLPATTMQRIAAAACDFDVPAGQLLIEANAPGSGMFVIVDGSVEVHTHTGTFQLGPGEAIGELALLTARGVRSGRAQATTPVRALALARDDFGAILADDHGLALWLLETIATRLADVSSAGASTR
jgi:CRP-like cAMP-binding protein